MKWIEIKNLFLQSKNCSMKKTLLLLIGFLISVACQAQKPASVSAVTIHESIQKLNVLGSVLYIAAHPDDENNRMITYFANHTKAHTTYLSLTRGDGGQNIIGPEIRELLGVIRTHEMLEARNIDGGHQLFSRANDFGYSKTPDETFNIWDRDAVLHDVVWAIRKLQPDVIVNRFDHRTPGTTHGHHTASAILSKEAFSLAADPSVYPEQLKFVNPYQPKRLFYNTLSHYESFQKKDKSQYYPIDIGTYYPLKGKSNNEVAAEARSRHQCQGMGTTATRGSEMEYMEWLAGSKPKSRSDMFSGIDMTWNRLKGGSAIKVVLEKVEHNFSHTNPAASIPELLKARKLILGLKKGYWKTKKLKDIEQIIVDCAGMFIEANTSEGAFVIGDKMEVNIEIVNRSEFPVQLNNIKIQSTDFDSIFSVKLGMNDKVILNDTILLKNNLNLSNAYWLNQESSLGMYEVNNLELLGLPVTPRDLKAVFSFQFGEYIFRVEKDILQKYTDPVVGEVYQPLEITPPVFVNIDESVLLFPYETVQEVAIKVTAGKDNLSGTLHPGHAEGWSVSPEKIDFNLSLKGEEQTFTFLLSPPKNQSEDYMQPAVVVDGLTYNQSINEINYPHIARQLVLLPAKAKTVRVDLVTFPQRIGYIQGTGDVVPECLKQIGYEVELIGENQLTTSALSVYDAVVVGIRAYNVRTKLKFQHKSLMEYVKNGGTVIVQYNTNHRLLLDSPGPFPITPSKDRVTVEGAPVKILTPQHDLMNVPNKITNKDFDDWVQERGLYFPNKWDAAYTPILSSHDPGEPNRDGGLLYCKYGKGYFIYTGYSWFRQLPAGVPGAYRIFANMLSIGYKKRP